MKLIPEKLVRKMPALDAHCYGPDPDPEPCRRVLIPGSRTSRSGKVLSSKQN
jgi:hypothetical protein